MFFVDDETNEPQKMSKNLENLDCAILSNVIWWLNFSYIEPKCESRCYFRSCINH